MLRLAAGASLSSLGSQLYELPRLPAPFINRRAETATAIPP
jgi:hypothetical protein